MKRLWRIAIIILLALALWNPGIPFGNAAVDVFLVLDDSLSMEGRLSQKLWSQIRRQLAELPADSRLAMIRYGKHPAQEIPLTAIGQPEIMALFDSDQPKRELPLDRTGSNLEAALWFAAGQIAAQPPTALLIVHDNQQTVGNTAPLIEKLQRQGHRLLQLNLAQADTAPDVWIQNLNVPLYGEAGQTLPVSVTLGSNKTIAGQLAVSVNGTVQRKQTIQLEADRLTAHTLNIENCGLDVCIVAAELEPESADAVPQNNKRQAAVTVNTSKALLYLHHHRATLPPLLASLQSWNNGPVNALTPDLCLSNPAALKSYQTIILDDIAVDDMQANCWSALEKAVGNEGTGLIVLGGPNSFSAGSYRHSQLEGLLPVTAEAAKQHQAGTLLFLVDKSGSMDSNGRDSSRIAMARQAVMETMKSQTQQDNFGLISFDAEPHLTIPIQHYVDPAAVIGKEFNSQAAGGTRLKPALDFALETLNKIDTPKRILVLVTDGFLDGQELNSVEQKISEENIEVLVMAIGNDARTDSLQRLADSSHGKLLHVGNIAELPLLMRKELDQRRLPTETGQIQVSQSQPLPFMPAKTSWPDLSGYAVTRPKPDATVYLNSPQGDPLLIARQNGIGKVIALPAGLDSWAQAWLDWREWGRFTSGLIHWAATNTHHPQLNPAIQPSGELQLDAINSARDWQSLGSGRLSISRPNQQIAEQPLALVAPGRYLGNPALQDKGLHKLSVNLDGLTTSLNVFNNANEEFIPNPQSSKHSIAESIQSWNPDALENPFEVAAAYKIRTICLVTALVLYLLLILATPNGLLRSLLGMQRT